MFFIRILDYLGHHIALKMICMDGHGFIPIESLNLRWVYRYAIFLFRLKDVWSL